MSASPSIVVVGSVNLDITATAARLPVAGETVTGATLARFPGGKGANQALAAKRLGADVSLIACVGADAYADEALGLLRGGGVDLSRLIVDEKRPTGVALIAVAESGENQIVVAPGANRALRAEALDLPTADALICQLEVPIDALTAAAEQFDGLFCMNLAPALPVPDELIDRADLIVVNETEAAYYGDLIREVGMLAVTHGGAGASLLVNGDLVAEARPPEVTPVDTTGAGDTFTAALVVALIEDLEPEEALVFACTAGALATTVAGAQTSLPLRAQVDALLAQASS